MNKREPFDRMVDIIIICSFLAVIGLKIAGIITISWLWLLSPIWGLFLIGCIISIILTIACIISIEIDKRRNENERY